MTHSDSSHAIYFEVGQKRVIAAAIQWPGWCRAGKDEAMAVQSLLAAAPRYAFVAQDANLPFPVPETPEHLNIVAQLDGSTTTDFGAPDRELPADEEPLSDDELERQVKLLQACWRSFDRAVEQAEGKELRKGPRGGGRELDKIIAHVVESEESYLKALGWSFRANTKGTMDERQETLRGEVVAGLQAAAAGQIEREGPRGGKRWSPRYFVRRLAWHVVDHIWEIEDRIV